MGYRRRDDSQPPDELPSRWEDEPIDAQDGEQGPTRLQRALNAEEEEYQKSLGTMIRNEEARLNYRRYYGGSYDPFDDGRPGLDMGGGGGWGRMFGWGWGYGYGRYSPFGLLISGVLLALAMIFRSCSGYDTTAPTQTQPRNQNLPGAASTRLPGQ